MFRTMTISVTINCLDFSALTNPGKQSQFLFQNGNLCNPVQPPPPNTLFSDLFLRFLVPVIDICGNTRIASIKSTYTHVLTTNLL